jgi:hypothetical protein
VVVNPAFLQEIKEDCWQAWCRFHSLTTTWSAHQGSSIESVNAWVRSLAEFRVELGRAFQLEDSYGYLQISFSHAAPRDLDAAVIMRQHAELMLELSELSEIAEESQFRGTVFRDFAQLLNRFGDFELRLRRHEQDETNLIHWAAGIRSLAVRPK